VKSFSKEGSGVVKSLDDICGRSLVEMGHFFRSIQAERHGGGLDCTFMDMDFVGECLQGFRSLWLFQCRVCHKKTTLYSENDKQCGFVPVNSAVVHAIVATGGGYSTLSELASGLNMHCMDNKTYNKYFNIVSSAIQDAAWVAMEEAGAMEVALALEEGNVDADGTPLCTVIGDGQWCKRSYKTKYDSLSGVVSSCSPFPFSQI
jgi:hypothetical protein